MSTSDQLYCHVCEEPLVTGTTGHSTFELSCPVCLASYHVEGDIARYVLSTFVEHHEPPIVIPVAELRIKGRVRHA